MNEPDIKVNVNLQDLSFEECISRGLELREKKDGISWELGDLADLVTNEFGPLELTKFAKQIGVDASTIRRYRDVARAYTLEQREMFKMLSWSSFRAVAGQENRMELLEKASDEGWSSEKLSIAAKNNGVLNNNIKAKPELILCDSCGKWKVIASADDLCPNDGSCEYMGT